MKRKDLCYIKYGYYIKSILKSYMENDIQIKDVFVCGNVKRAETGNYHYLEN